MTQQYEWRQLAGAHVLVVGDLILDRYAWGNVDRISPEAPIPVLRIDSREIRPGGAASVAALTRALGGAVTLFGVTGDDAAGRALRTSLEATGVDISHVFSVSDRPTTLKERFIGRAAGRHAHQILRVDEESTAPLHERVCRELLLSIEEAAAGCDAILVSDYDKGVCTEALMCGLRKIAADRSLPVIVDPARREAFAGYRSTTVLTPNRVETTRLSGLPVHSVADAFAAGDRILGQLDVAAIFVTLDRDGIVLVTATGVRRHFPTEPRAVYDTTGAGDTVLATIGLALAAGRSLDEAAEMANVTAGIQVEHVGVVPVTGEMISERSVSARRERQRIVSADSLARLTEEYRAHGQRVVFTNGCFDLFHVGHLRYLQEAAQLGDRLVVAINGDAGVRRLKGPDRPVIGQADRASLLAGIACVDHVVIFDQPTPCDLLRAVRPDVLVKGGDYSIDQVVGREIVEAYGGQVRVLNHVPGRSTSEIVKAVRTNGQLSAQYGHGSRNAQVEFPRKEC